GDCARMASKRLGVPCRACGRIGLSEFLDLGNMPLAGGFLRSSEDIQNERTYPLPVHVCDACGLVQIVEPVDPEVLFRDYAFASSTVGPLINHFTDYAKWLNDRYRPGLVFEFGCNDGTLFAPLEKLVVPSVCIDISDNITNMAREKGLKVVTGYFGPQTADAMVA